MKLLTLLRHGKSEWKDAGENDFDRPLRDRGRRDAPFMGRVLAALDLTPDLIVRLVSVACGTDGRAFCPMIWAIAARFAGRIACTLPALAS